MPSAGEPVRLRTAGAGLLGERRTRERWQCVSTFAWSAKVTGFRLAPE